MHLMNTKRTMREIKMINLHKVFMSPTASESVAKVLSSCYIGQGPKVEEFEKKISKKFNNDYLLTMNSCTSALTLALHLIKKDFKETDEILVSPLTCFATIAAIIDNGYKVRWADIDPNTCNIDTFDVERKVGPNTRGVVLVHWGGYPANLDHIKIIATKYKNLYGRDLPIIEDCAHCWNSKYKEELIGNSGNYCCFSFQAIKFLTTGDGGLLISPNATIHHRAKLLRWFGLDRDSGASFRCMQNISESGFKYQLNDIAAAIGLENLEHMDRIVTINKDNAYFYNKELKNTPGITLLETSEDVESCYWIYTLKVEDRSNFIKYLKSNGIESSQVHNRCDQHTCVSEYLSFLPGMDSIENNYICIPVGWWVTNEQRQEIVNLIKKGW